VTLWYMSMDFAPLLEGGNDSDWKYRKVVSMILGLGILALALYVDIDRAGVPIMRSGCMYSARLRFGAACR
jgi:hypothetical protein